MVEEVDILIVGGGVAGLTAAAALAAPGRRVLCLDQAPAGAGAADSRTTAFLRPAVQLLIEIGVWPRLEGEIAALNTMRLIDAGGRENAARETSDFVAAEVAEPPFGWNVPNRVIRAALEARLDELEGVELRHGAQVSGLTPRRDEMIAATASGPVRAQLVVGADGRDSAVRRLSGIGAKRVAYDQKALVCTLAHELPHEGVSTEIHRTGGPFTLVPMPDGEEGHRSALVWMERPASIDRLLTADVDAFEAEANARSLGELGRLRLISPRAAWPMISLLAHRLTAPRTALIAEAAHVVPPIGAQGLNMSLGDIAALRAAIGDGDPGRAEALKSYQKRWPELVARVAGVGALNIAAMAEAQPLRDLRRMGLGAISNAPPLRRMAMRLGLGMPRAGA